ncbi:MAG: prepilin-type N-terminal cleavage/methylation domain-containing protein [Myxococcota bacterium]|nr:prepilin-type N-terminal cleavage/methylation domain-containing protein [Myxococcota bacterium]
MSHWERFLQRCGPPRALARRGLTLIELAVVLAIVGIVAAIGWGSTRAYIPRFRMITAAKGLKADTMKLRSLAVSTGRETRLTLSGTPGTCTDAEGYGGSWTMAIGNRSSGSSSWDLLPEDTAADGSDDDRSEGTVDIGPEGNRTARGVCLRQWASLAGPGAGNGDSIVFSPRGFITNPSSDFSTVAGTIDLTLVNLHAASRGVTDEVSVRLFRTGAARLESTLGAEYAGSAAAGTETSSSRQ